MTERSRNALRVGVPHVFVAGAEPSRFEALMRDPMRHGARVIKRNTRRAVYAVASPVGEVIVKVHALSGLRGRWSARFFGSRARFEIETAQGLLAAGIETPEPIALYEHPAAGFAASAIRAVAGATPLGSYLEARFVPNDGRAEEKRPWAARAVALLAKMHRAGFDHRDFHGGNLLVDARGELSVIDLHRVARGEPSRARRIRALADLLHTLRFALDDGDDEFALGEYARASKRVDLTDAAALKSLRSTIARRERERVRSRSKRCLVESSGFARIETGGCRGFRRRDRDQSEIFAAIAAAEAQIESGGPLVRSLSRRSSVAIGEAAGRRYAVKIYHKDGRRQLRGRATGGRGKRAWKAANALDVRELAVARPIAWIQTPDRSVLVTDEVEGALPLHVLSFSLTERTSALCRSVARAVADLVGDVFTARVRVNDLSPKNVLVVVAGGRARAVLCDFDGVRLRRASTERMIEALAQLNDLAPGVGAVTRLLVLRRLKRRVPALFGRGVASAIAVVTARRAARVLAALPQGALPLRVN